MFYRILTKPNKLCIGLNLETSHGFEFDKIGVGIINVDAWYTIRYSNLKVTSLPPFLASSNQFHILFSPGSDTLLVYFMKIR